MTSLAILETSLSLFVQVTLLIGIAAVMARRQQSDQNADSCWAMLHVAILLVTLAAFFLPHLRLTVWADLHPTENYPPGLSTLQIVGSFISWTWGVGALVVVAMGIAGIVKAMSIVRRSKKAHQFYAQIVEAVPGLARASQPIEIRLTDGTTGAFCWQIHRPVIVLPTVVVDFPVAEKAAIVRHELAHLRRQHPLHLFIQRLVEAVYWFHPLVWWASHQAAAAREIRCDRDAVSTRQEVAAYLRSLLRLIELRLAEPTLLPAGIGFLGSSSLLGRRANLLVASFDKPVAPIARWRSILVFGLALVGCVLVWLPVNPRASRRSDWSPWPRWSAQTLDALGMPVRDYEIDGHRLDGHEH
jgi:beta-lactamase regulating signal transducer with metallopeptidase domain